MKTKSLSQREKKLLYILLCLVIIVVGWYFLINPTLESSKTLKSEYDTMSTQFQIDKEVIKAYGDLDTANEKIVSDIEVHKSNFYDYIHPEDVDKTLTTLVQKHGLVPVSLILEDAIGQTLSEYGKDKETTETTETPETTEDEEALIKVMNVKQTVSTVKLSTNTVAYIETIRQTPGIHITSLAYSSGDKEGAIISLEYKIYMLEK